MKLYATLQKHKFSKPFRIFITIITSLLIVYSIIGFIAIPFTLKWILTKHAPKIINQDIHVQKVHFNPFSYALSLENLEIVDQQGARMLSLKKLLVNFQLESLWANDWQFKTISLDTPFISAILDENGQINLMDMIPKPQPNSTDANANEPEQNNTEPKEPKYLTISTCEIINGTILFIDKMHSEPFTYALRPINTKLENFNTHISRAGGMKLTLIDGPQGTISIEGFCDTNPLQGYLNLNITSLDLATFQPYVEKTLPLIIKNGFLNTKAAITFKADSNNKPIIGFNGDINFANVQLNDAQTKETFLNLDNFAFNGIDFSLREENLSIEQLLLNKPTIKAIQSSTGDINLARCFSPSKKPKNKTLPETKTETPKETPIDENETSPAPNFNFNIKEFRVQQGSFSFNDQSMNPAFQVQLSKCDIILNPISSNLEESINFDIQSTLDESGSIKLNGSAHPMNLEAPKTIKLTLKDYQTTNLSPYMQKYLGYFVNQGRLELDINYDISPTNFEGTHHLQLHKFTLGDKTDNPDAIKLPIKFALSLLENRKQQIDLNVPVNGNPSDPKFKFGHIIMFAFKNIFTKIITSPFSVLANVAGGNESESLDFVVFKAGSSQIMDTEKDKLLKVATALNDRPKLLLEIQGSFNPTIDRDALKQSDYQASYQAMKIEYEKTEDEIIELMFKKHIGWKQFSQLQKAHKQAQKALGQKFDNAKFIQEVRRQLIEQYQVEQNILNELAGQRSAAIQNLLIEQGKLETERIKIKAAITEITDSNESVKLQLFLLPR